jgi:hypothetical protein
MTTVKHAIAEHDVVALTQAVDRDETLTRPADELRGVGKWPAGTVGAIVSDFGDHKMVEIANDRGEALDFITVPVEQLRLLAEQ